MNDPQPAPAARTANHILEITALDEAIVLDDRRQGTLRLVIANRAARPLAMRCRMVAKAPLEASWLSVRPAGCELEAGGRREVLVSVTVPREAPAGVRMAHLVVWSMANPDEDFLAGPEVVITVPPPVRRFRLRLSRWVVVGLIGLVVVGLSAALAVMAANSYRTITPTRVSVPDLSGKPREQLAQVLGTYLTVGTITAQATGDRPFGTVITQTPAAGVLVKPQTAVEVVVEDGVRMPTLVGQMTAAAQAVVQTMPLRLAEVVPLAEASTAALGTVIRQDPPAGAVVAAGALVTLTELAAVQVPQVVGMTVAEATSELRRFGLEPGLPADSKDWYQVTAQDQPVGRGLKAGSKVLMTLQALPDPNPPPVKPATPATDKKGGR